MKKIKYFKVLSKEQCENCNIDFDKLINNSKEYFEENGYLKDLLPSMSFNRNSKQAFKNGQTIYLLLADRIFAFEIYEGECVESNYHHTIFETDFDNFREVLI